MGEKKGYMVLTPAGTFKSPNNPECAGIKIADEVALAAAAILSPNREGLKFIASTHAAHYQTCESCRAANPTPDPHPTAENKAEVAKYEEHMEEIIRKTEADPLAAALSLFTKLGVDPSTLLGDDEVRKLLEEGHKYSATHPQPKRTIGFVN